MKNYSIKDIQDFLSEELSLKWERLIRIEDKQRFRTARLEDFEYNPTLYLTNEKDKSYLAKVRITNDEFIFKTLGDSKIDASIFWKEFLEFRKAQKTNVNL
ncbi:MAG: hypothetical protein IJX26_02010 [Clostridia bacterium]|nr:hypothetical protein [Clostridia bacterium]